MNRFQQIDNILDQTMILSMSYGTSPYSISHIKIEKQLRDIISQYEGDFSDMIVVSIWKDYTEKDLEDYVALSKECLSIENDSERKMFIKRRLNKILIEEKRECKLNCVIG